jgi:hypothetical protein
MGALFDEMLTLRPTTLEGFRALALATVEHCWTDEDEVIVFGHTADCRAIALLMSALTGLPIPAVAEEESVAA